MTPLDKPLKRLINVDGKDYTLVIDPQGLKITEKGHRLGVEVVWKALLSGDGGHSGASPDFADSH